MDFPENHTQSLNKLFSTLISIDRWLKEESENIGKLNNKKMKF